TVHSTELESYQTGKFDHPAAWFGLRGTTIQFKPGFKTVRVPNGDTALELIRKHIGRTVMVHTRGEVDHLLAGNVRRLEEIILDKLKARVKKGHDYEVFYAQIAFAAGITDKSTRKMRDLNINPVAREMMIHSRRFAHAALREPYKPSKDRDEAWAYWMMARTVFHDRWVEGPHIDKAEGEVIDKLVESYRELAMPLEARQFGQKPAWERTQHLGLFDAFRHTSFGGFTHDQREDFLEFAETLGRRYVSRQEKKGNTK
ncbi:MAG: hypothetical protein K2Q20_03060, partial [Phycisphaerales bacterium]|nr:hypothetical protein [Phycisphaerales bacterium]